jgi:putative ATP-dependent endonuclease of OLD family
MGIAPIVVHDRDGRVFGAEVFKQPIADALADGGKVIQMHENIEDDLGYPAPASEKPFKAYQHTQKWGEDWDGIPALWKAKIVEIFGDYVES